MNSKSETPEQTATSEYDYSRPEPAFGWTIYSERMNGRFAMIGFVSVLVLEALTGQGLLTWMGLR